MLSKSNAGRRGTSSTATFTFNWERSGAPVPPPTARDRPLVSAGRSREMPKPRSSPKSNTSRWMDVSSPVSTSPPGGPATSSVSSRRSSPLSSCGTGADWLSYAPCSSWARAALTLAAMPSTCCPMSTMFWSCVSSMLSMRRAMFTMCSVTEPTDRAA